MNAYLNLPEMVIDIFTLSVKFYLIICYDQIHDVFDLTSNHYVPGSIDTMITLVHIIILAYLLPKV